MDEHKNIPGDQGDVKDLFRMLDKMEGRNTPAEPEEFPPVRSATRDGAVEGTTPQPPQQEPVEEFDLIDPYEIEMQEQAEPDVLFFSPNAEELEDYPEDGDLPPIPPRRNPFVVIWEGLRSNLPARGDTPGELARKGAFLLALLVLLISLGYIVADVLVMPMQNEQLYQGLQEVYHPENSEVMEDKEGNYPTGMLASFRELYDRNDEVRGWISYHASGNKDFLKIDYPIMFSGDNDKYLTRDFNEKKNKNGALFFDKNNKLNSTEDVNKSLIVYGHNMASGQMFAGLNKFIGSVSNARAATEITMSTLYENNTYQVFAVLITDEDEVAKWYFNTRRTQFSSDEDFLSFVQRLRDRSLFDYPVTVTAEDELLVLSTCTAKSTAKIKNGRLVVVARKMRPGDTKMPTDKIQRNSDVIMPRSWYINQGLVLHEYYGGDHSGITTTTGKRTFSTMSTSTSISHMTTGTGTSGTRTTSSGSKTTALIPGSNTTPSGNTTSMSKPTNSTAPTSSSSSTTSAGNGSSTTPTNSTVSTDSTTATTESTEPTESTGSTESTTPTEPTETTPSDTEPTEEEKPTEPTAPTEPTNAGENGEGGENSEGGEGGESSEGGEAA